jgi:histidinol-phosphate aminotransferase
VIRPRPGIERVVRVDDPAVDREHYLCLDKNERVDDRAGVFFKTLLGQLSPRDLTQYPVIEFFRRRLAARVGLPAESVLLTAGSDPAIKAVFEVFVRRGDRVVLPRPTFAMYNVYGRLFGARLVELTYGDRLAFPVKNILAALEDRPRLLVLPNPNSPTGTLLSRNDLRSVLTKARRRSTVVLVDEAYFEFSGATALDWVPRFPNLVVTRTFSKAGGLAGVRLGFAAAHPRTIDLLRRVKPMYEINGVALRFGETLLKNPGLVARYARDANRGRDYLERQFRRLGLRAFKSHANFILVPLPDRLDARAIADALRKKKVLIKGGFPDAALRNCLRVTTAPVPVMKKFWKIFEPLYREVAA